jgi:CheY-like chemotaxis protein
MKETIHAIKTGSERINNVVTNLKDFARADESAYLKPVQVNQVIEKTMTIVGAQVRRSVANLEMTLACDLPEIQGHFQRLEQVVANLVINAVDAISNKDQGRISIVTRYLDRLRSVLIEVEDNGCGMEPQIVSQLFEPFFTTRREIGGTGLGLSVSYGLVQDHNGRIGVLSRPGQGSRFTVFLPVDSETKLEIRPTLLCVDDDKSFLDNIKMSFVEVEDRYLEVTSNPESVLPYLEEHPEVDMVLSDVLMPGVNGWELLEKIKTRFPLVAVILFSGSMEELKSKPGSEVKPDSLLQKPFQMKKLLEIINTIGRQRL